MSVTVGSLTIDALRAQPYGYEETDTISGLVARKWTVDGLLTPDEWLSLLAEFDGWWGARVLDADTSISGVIGSTISFSGASNGQQWTDVACWFTSAPQGTQAGAYIAASFELIDATQALAVLLKQQQTNQEVSDSGELENGTITLGTTVITLLQQPDGYVNGPQLEKTAVGGILVSGPLGVTRTKQVNGWTTEDGWTQLKSWYETIVASSPISGDLYPIGEISMEREAAVIDGIKTTRCVVSLTLWEV